MPAKAMSQSPAGTVRAVEAAITSKGQVTLPKAVRKCLGVGAGSRIRFAMLEDGTVQVEPVTYALEDLWKFAGEQRNSGPVMSFEEMNEAKARRAW